jgi:hypothetical protein
VAIDAVVEVVVEIIPLILLEWRRRAVIEVVAVGIATVCDGWNAETAALIGDDAIVLDDEYEEAALNAWQ